MSTHNIGFYAELAKYLLIIIIYTPNPFFWLIVHFIWQIEPHCEKTGQRGFRHKPGCAATEGG